MMGETTLFAILKRLVLFHAGAIDLKTQGVGSFLSSGVYQPMFVCIYIYIYMCVCVCVCV